MTALGKINYIHSCVDSFNRTRYKNVQQQQLRDRIKIRKQEIASKKQKKVYTISIFAAFLFIFITLAGVISLKSAVFNKEKENAALEQQISAVQAENIQLEALYESKYNGQEYLDYVNALGMTKQHPVVYINSKETAERIEADKNSEN